jgi:hypothetical protein
VIGLQLRISGEQQYARFFDVMADEVTHLREPLSRVSRRLTETVGQQFFSEGSHGGAPWPALNPTYERWKDEAYPGRPMLVRTGQMRAAFLADGQRELTQSRLAWGVDTQRDSDGQLIAERAGAHQAGEGHVPERKIIALRMDDRRFIDHEFVAYINGLRHSLLGGAL